MVYVLAMNSICDTADTTLPMPSAPGPSSTGPVIRGDWHAWMKPDIATDAGSPIHLSRWYDPADSPSLAPGERLPELSANRHGGSRSKGKTSKGKCLTRGKGSRAERTAQAYARDQEAFPHLHPRLYILNESHLVTPVPAPTVCQLNREDGYVDTHGILRTFVTVATPYTPVVTLRSENQTRDLILRHFGLLSKL